MNDYLLRAHVWFKALGIRLIKDETGEGVISTAMAASALPPLESLLP
jgi:hypothetical protein